MIVAVFITLAAIAFAIGIRTHHSKTRMASLVVFATSMMVAAFLYVRPQSLGRLGASMLTDWALIGLSLVAAHQIDLELKTVRAAGNGQKQDGLAQLRIAIFGAVVVLGIVLVVRSHLG